MDLASACNFSCKLVEPFSKSYSLFQYLRKFMFCIRFLFDKLNTLVSSFVIRFYCEAGFPTPQWFLWFSWLSPIVQHPFFGIWWYRIGAWQWPVEAVSAMSTEKMNSCLALLCLLKFLNPCTLGCAGDTDLCSGLCNWHEAVVRSCSWGLSFSGRLLLNMKPHLRSKYKHTNKKTLSK